jgi:dipeptide transport system ATP-binding protein
VRCHFPLGEPGRLAAIEADRPRSQAMEVLP